MSESYKTRDVVKTNVSPADHKANNHNLEMNFIRHRYPHESEWIHLNDCVGLPSLHPCISPVSETSGKEQITKWLDEKTGCDMFTYFQ